MQPPNDGRPPIDRCSPCFAGMAVGPREHHARRSRHDATHAIKAHGHHTMVVVVTGGGERWAGGDEQPILSKSNRMVFVVLSLFSVTMIGVLSDAGPRCSFLADVDHNCKDDPSNCVGEKDGNK